MRSLHTLFLAKSSHRMPTLLLTLVLLTSGALAGCGNDQGGGGTNDTFDLDGIDLNDIDLDGIDVDQDILSQLDIKTGDTIGGDAQDAKDSGGGTDTSAGTDTISGTDSTGGTDATDTEDSIDAADSGESDIATGCQSDSACDDQNLCTDDKCGSDGQCSHSFNAVPCDDGVTCTTDNCADGKCLGMANDASCTDDNGCTADSCDLALGCTHTAIEGACDDGNPCTLAEACTAGACAGGEANPCDDNNPCTLDGCALPDGCTHTALDTATLDVVPSCSDDNNCTSGDSCFQGACVGQALGCDDENICTDDSCNPADGTCVHAANSAPCDDGIACSTGDTCVDMACAGTLTDSLCDDNNPCSNDWCSTDGGCNHGAAEATCSDGNPCTNDYCNGTTCESTPKVCDDGNSCTGDNCDPSTGDCAFTNILNGQCAMADNVCVLSAGCVEGKCVALESQICADDNLCTDDTCDPSQGCVFLANAATCDDGDLCTENDTCGDKKCAGAEKLCLGDPNSPDCSMGFCDGKTGQCTIKSAAWYEDFSRKGKGWKLEGEWQIGMAMATTPVMVGEGTLIGDPGTDADGTTDGYLAGMVIGGDIANTPHDWVYLTSPVIDLSAYATPTAFLDIQATGALMGSLTQQAKVELTADGQTWVDAITIGDINQSWQLLSSNPAIPAEMCTAKFQFRIGYRIVTMLDYIAPIVAGLSVDNISIISGNCW